MDYGELCDLDRNNVYLGQKFDENKKNKEVIYNNNKLSVNTIERITKQLRESISNKVILSERLNTPVGNSMKKSNIKKSIESSFFNDLTTNLVIKDRYLKTSHNRSMSKSRQRIQTTDSSIKKTVNNTSPSTNYSHLKTHILSKSQIKSSISPIQKKRFTCPLEEIDKLYSKREKGELSVTRGIVSITKMNLFNFTLQSLKFTKGSKFILDVDLKKLLKYDYSIHINYEKRCERTKLDNHDLISDK